MATCRECSHWDECSIADGTTQFYGKEIAAGNVEELCVPFVPTKTETETEFLLREGKRRNIIPIAKDITVKAKVKRYRKKPVVIEAFRLGYDNVPDWFMDKLESNDARVWINSKEGVRYARIKTLEGTMTANVGDFIIKGVKGELYPCKADIFEATYEAVDDEESEICCAECKHLMFSDCYGECSKGYKGIVHPDDSCGKGKLR